MFIGSIWAGTLLTLMWLPGGNNVLGSRPKAELSLVMDLPATVGIKFLAQEGLYLCKDAVNKVGKGPAA